MKRRVIHQATRPCIRRQRPLTKAAYQRLIRMMHYQPVNLGDLFALLGEFERLADTETRQRLGMNLEAGAK